MKRALLISVAAMCCSAVMAQWVTDPELNTQLISGVNEVYSDEMRVNQDGVVFYNFNGPVGGNTNTYIQILDADGKQVLGQSGKLVSDERARSWLAVNQMVLVDNEGNAILSVSDCRYAPAETDALSYTLYKVSPTGEMLWGEDGIGLEQGEISELEAKMSMIQLEDGSYVFAWMRINGDAPQWIEIQRLSKDGKFLWDAPKQLKSETVPYTYPYLVNAGDNQFILVYAQGSSQYLMAQKYDFDGEPVWAKATTVYKGGFGSIPLWTFVSAIPDEEGGVFVGWYDDRYYTNCETSYVSHILSDGSYGYVSGVDGTALSQAEYNRCFAPSMAYDAAEECLYTVHRELVGTSSFNKLVVQKVNKDGELMWGVEGSDLTEVSDQTNVSYATIQITGDGDAVAFWLLLDGIASNSSTYGYAARLDGASADATKVWTTMFASNPSNKVNLISTPLVKDGYFLTFFEDNRFTASASKYDQFMQPIMPNGELGVPTAIRSTYAGGNDLLQASVEDGQVRFALNTTGEALLAVYAASGEEVARPFQGCLTAEGNEVVWSTEGLPKGIYLVRLTTEGGTQTIKIIQ